MIQVLDMMLGHWLNSTCCYKGL